MFQVKALEMQAFAPLFEMDDEALAQARVVRAVADAPHGFPCRVSLQDAEVGDALLLVNYEHQPAPTPYRASHAIWVRAKARTAHPAPGDIPDVLRRRTLSLRAFDAAGMIVAADLVEGAMAEGLIEKLLADERTAYIHAHYARPGCYAARIDRA